MSGRLPSVELGFRPRGGTSRFASSPCVLTSTSQRGRRRVQLAKRLFVSTVHPVSALGDYAHASTKLPTRERRPRIMPILASSVCDFNIKTNHIPRTCLPTLLTLMLLEHSFITRFHLRGGFLFSTLVLDIMKWYISDKFSLCILAICTQMPIYLNTSTWFLFGLL